MFRTARLVAVAAALAAVLACLAKPANAAPIGDDTLVATPLQPSQPALQPIGPASVPPTTQPQSLNQPLQPWYFGVMLRRATTAVGGGLRIDSMRSDGPMAQAGLSPGDVVLAAGGSSLQQVRSKRLALSILRGSVQAQPLPPGACLLSTPRKGQVVLTVLDGRDGSVNRVLVEPILTSPPTQIASAGSTQPTVFSNGNSTLSIPATFDPRTGQRLSPPSGTLSLVNP